MKKVVIFLVVFFLFDRFMNYQLDFNKKNAHHKSRVVLAHTKSVTAPRYSSFSKKSNKSVLSDTFNTYKRMFLATFMDRPSTFNHSSVSSLFINEKNHSSNRNV